MLRFVPEATTAIFQTFGKFSRTTSPGLVFYIPIVQNVSLVSNRLQQDIFQLGVKTKDDVRTHLELAVQYEVLPEDSAKAFFKMTNPKSQIESFIQSVVRAHVPRMDLDDLFLAQDEISEEVEKVLNQEMIKYGYTIKQTLLTDIVPDRRVQDAMNQIEASKRLKLAAVNEADAEYYRTVREAEAAKKRKELQGEGIALQRQAIYNGLEESMETMAKKLDLSPREIIELVLKVQELDTKEMIGRSDNTKILFMENSASGLAKEIIGANECRSNNPL